MNPERWARVEEIFKAALARAPSERSRFIEQACGDDSDLEREVVSLLASDAEAGSFLDAPVVEREKLEEAIAAPAGLTFLPDQIVSGRFKIVRFLAEGGMGEVYEAWDQDLNEKVALKTIRLTIADDEAAESRFMREIQLARRVTHPNVCRVYDTFRHRVESGSFEGEVRYLTMELLAGETLGQRLRRGGSLSPARAAPIAEQIAMALDAAHDVGIVHRDLKPDNVILVPHKKRLRAVVTDFGLARADASTVSEPLTAIATSREDLLWTLHGLQAGFGNIKVGAWRRLARHARRQLAAFGLVAPVDETLTQQGDVMGTPAYMSPEQARGARADVQSDVWSYGVLVYEMLTGELPYRRESSWAQWLRKLANRKPSAGRLRRVPPYLQKVVRRCLELDRSERYRDFDEILADLRRGRSAARGPPPPRAWRRALLAAIAVVLAVTLYWFLR